MSTMDDGHERALARQRSLRNLQYNMYASRKPNSPQRQYPPALEFRSDGPVQTSYQISHERPPSQLPPLPVSPRWDTANHSNHFVFPKAKAALSVPSPLEHRQPSYDSSPHSHYPPLPPSAGLTPWNEPPPDLSSLSEPEHRISTDTTQSNFSRPRKPSIKQPRVDSSNNTRQTYFPSPYAPPPDALSEFSSPQAHLSRPRGESSPSAHPSSPSSLAPLANSSDMYDPGRSRLRHAATAPPAVRTPPFGPNHMEGVGPTYSRDMAPWMSADESRSSYRSQFTSASSAQGTSMTERSSVVTRDSSVPSVYAGPDEPSVEDVMGMYERGFHDDSSPEDQEDTPRDAEMNKRNTRILEALDRPLLAQATMSTGGLTPPASAPLVRASNEMFRAANPSPLAADDGVSETTTDKRDSEDEKRDSAKSLNETQSLTQSETSRTHSPPVRQASSMTTTTTSSAPSSVVVELEEPGARDRYGFKKQNQYITREQYDAWDAKYSEYLERRKKKWIAYQKEDGLMTDNPIRFPKPSAAKTKRFVRKGIPPEWRGAAWFYYAGGPAILAKHSGVYNEMLQRRIRAVDKEAIERDLHRTFPDNINFKPANGGPNTEPERAADEAPDKRSETPMIGSLRRVLRAFAIYNPHIGYCQSLNFLAGLLILFMETEEQAFWLLNVITRVYLPGTHDTSLEGSKVDLGVLMGSIRESMPAVWEKIGDDMEGDPNAPRPVATGSAALRKMKPRRRHMATQSTDRLPPITLCMTAWFMSCFIGTLPIETTLRVWDVFFLEGSKTLFRVALTIFKLGEAEVKAVTDPMEMFGVVQAMPRRMIDANLVMESCFKRRNGFNNLTQDAIDTRRQERRDKVHAAEERQASANGSGPGTPTNGQVQAAAQGGDRVLRKGTLFGRKPK